MALEIPSYVRNAEIQDNHLRYRWDDSNPQQAYAVSDGEEELSDQTERLSFRANMALTIASAEWVIHRYDLLSDDRTPHEYLEASWAAVVDHRYLCPWEVPAEDWRGPIRAPIAVALLIVQEAVRAAVHEDSLGVPVLYMSNLAKYILPQSAAFLAWRDPVIDRLREASPFDPQETLGEVVPREAFDLGSSFVSSTTEFVINGFLARLNPGSNPFLHSPEEMVELHFDGIPYRFDIQKDRRDRMEW